MNPAIIGESKWWIAGWAPTIGGLVVSAGGMNKTPAALFQVDYIAFFTSFSISFTTFCAVTCFFPAADPRSFDAYDGGPRLHRKKLRDSAPFPTTMRKSRSTRGSVLQATSSKIQKC
jgi:hypothetical protein